MIVSHMPILEPSASTLRSLQIDGPAGRLEALLNEGSPRAGFAALVCHPHPLGGGTMHNKIVYHMMKVLNSPEWGFEWPVLRFNFRGTGLSAGTHHGSTESGDVEAALRWMRAKFHLPMVVVGFSFGAAMAVQCCCGNQRACGVHALAAISLPLHAEGREYRYPGFANSPLPKLLISGSDDQFSPAADLQKLFDTIAEPRQLTLIPGADHFFTGQLSPLQSTLAAWLTTVTLPTSAQSKRIEPI